jgi:hypothetical protein
LLLLRKEINGEKDGQIYFPTGYIVTTRVEEIRPPRLLQSSIDEDVYAIG